MRYAHRRLSFVHLVCFSLLLFAPISYGFASNEVDTDTVNITLTHPSEPSVRLSAPSVYFPKDSFVSSRKSAEGGELEAINISFVYPGFHPYDSGLQTGDCDTEHNTCRYYAEVTVTIPGATQRIGEGDLNHPQGDDFGYKYGLKILFPPESESLLRYYYKQDPMFPSGVYVNCIRASRQNIARCRILFETDSGLAVTLGGVRDLELHQWKELVSQTSDFIDSFIAD